MNQNVCLTLRSWGGLLSLSLSLLSSVAWAASHTAAQAHLISVNRLFESLEYERALEQIHLARQEPRGTEEDITLFLYEGVILVELGQREQGAAAFKSALLLQPEAKLPVQVAPKVEALFESMRQEVKAERAAVLAKQESQHGQAEDSPLSWAHPTQPSTAASTAVSSRASLGGNLRRYSLLPAIAGGSLVVAGGISWALSRTELNRLRSDDPRLATREDVLRARSRGHTWQTVGVSLLSVGVAGLATAAGLYVLGAPSTPVALGVSTDGTSAIVHGRWP